MDKISVANNIASQLLKIKAVTLNPKEPFVWASGIKAPIYTDNRLTIAYPDFRQTIAHDLAELIKEKYPEAEVIGGVATAGIPHATGVSNILNLPLNYVRPQKKDHGKKSQIEGRCQKGDKVVLIDDLISTGGSILKAVKAVEEEGGDVIGTVAIFSYDLPESTKNFADAHTKLFTLTDYPTMIQVAQKLDYVEESDMELLQQWYQNPESWGK
ncbi:orotate phosphoribosyltransferase [Companilactobacillus pabuli]|jgi:orotate phosphoribosyltransferase|uniref:Orotate phosphoribosyltransferase n=1 Tax=Companilactobacillus pabuli TaxID=2714036 RepID=A0A7L7KVP0_9LACO|nr:orotate phosphoribosyltransferase [Companilactobacillus pabuli]AKP04064.1 orotate phosphoribosyltransferase [Companilactobacillus farciminis]AKS52369.1 orotate phosphoribosyltransferase [Companilactobacillus farciminis]MDG5113333.1 orotate phosphoribosyltransferase [Companilactobacillus pabuli]QMT83867.1 orotate phosphoribosyltransferase [Companilactobacillus pabuli]GAQ02379.1 orotate phosphoribosyltransferase [Companilactobacillus farciminis]